MRYTYIGDKMTDPRLFEMQCDPIRRTDGKCVVSQKMATALVVDENEVRHVVLRRRLRLNSKLKEKATMTQMNMFDDSTNLDATIKKIETPIEKLVLKRESAPPAQEVMPETPKGATDKNNEELILTLAGSVTKLFDQPLDADEEKKLPAYRKPTKTRQYKDSVYTNQFCNKLTLLQQDVIWELWRKSEDNKFTVTIGTVVLVDNAEASLWRVADTGVVYPFPRENLIISHSAKRFDNVGGMFLPEYWQ